MMQINDDYYERLTEDARSTGFSRISDERHVCIEERTVHVAGYREGRRDALYRQNRRLAGG